MILHLHHFTVLKSFFCKTYRQINIGRLYLAIDFCNALCFTSLFHSANPVKIRGSCKNTQRFSHRQNHLGHQNQGQSKGCTKEPGLQQFSVVSWAVRFVHEKKYRHLAKSFEQQRKLESKNKGREIVKQFIRNDSEWLTLIACTKRTTSQKIVSQVSNNKLLGEHRSTRDIIAAKNASDIIQSLHSLNFLHVLHSSCDSWASKTIFPISLTINLCQADCTRK